MLKFFKDKTVQLLSKQKSTNEIIEEIHETFFTEVDRLLAEAKIINSLETNKQHLIDKRSRLRALGFTNTKEVKEAEKELARIEQLKSENKKKKTLVEMINYFSSRYPNYKFITEESVKRICQKYGLVYGAIDKYIGTVPDKNLKHIESFKILEDDVCWIQKTNWSGSISYKSKNQITKEGGVTRLREFDSRDHMYDLVFPRYNSRNQYGSDFINMESPLEIAAPQKDFNMEGMEVKDFHISKIEVPDPIVLKPVIFEGQKHYLIVTAWAKKPQMSLWLILRS